MNRKLMLSAATLSPLDKGVPPSWDPNSDTSIASREWNILREDFPFPIAVLKQTELEQNIQWMRKFVESQKVLFAPHGKTTMSPALFEMQRANGAWAITVATPHQLQVARQFGFNRIVLANQLIGRSAIEFVLNELNRNAEFEFYCLVDSTAALEQLYRYGSGNPALKRIFVLVELGYEGGRTGCRSTDQALSIARSIVDHNKVAIKGVEGFEGLLRGSTPAESTQLVEAFLDRLVEFAQACDAEALLPAEAILSAGGSAYFDLVVARLTAARLSIEPRIVLRSGCYLTHDSLMYTKAFARMHDRSKAISDLGEGLKPAMEVWAYIQSRPEPSLAIAMLGKRDISHDEMPVPLAWHHPGSSDSPKPLASDQYRVSKLNDQHCHMLVPSDSPLSVGDLVSFGISHPCLTFDKWRVIHLVDSNYNVVDSIQTFF